jgi:hypothetical protein
MGRGFRLGENDVDGVIFLALLENGTKRIFKGYYTDQ